MYVYNFVNKCFVKCEFCCFIFLFKVFFCGRSDYFKVLLNDYFGESRCLENNFFLVIFNDVFCDIFI